MSSVNAYPITLNPDQTLSDAAPPLQGKRIIIEANTGVGKTYYLLNTVATQTPLVWLVPTVNQLQQLAATYGERADYVDGQRHPETLGPVIIATYDQAPWIVEQLGAACAKYVLAIDELHQLYQAGSYRASALFHLYALIETIGEPGQFRQLIGVSATLNPDLLYFEPDTWWTVRRAGAPTHSLRLVEYADPNQWRRWLTEERETFLKPDQLHVIRLDEVERLEELAHYFTGLGYRVLTVHSRIQDSAAVQERLASQVLDPSYNLLLTTSLIDEGINLMNTALGSIHVIGATTHLAEVRQCLDRFQAANPVVYLHVSFLARDETSSLDLTAEGNKRLDQMAEIAALVADLLPPGSTLTQAQRLVQKWNRFLHGLLHFEPLLLVEEAMEWTVKGNAPGLAASLFRLEATHQYEARPTLMAALEAQFPGCTVQRRAVDGSDSPVATLKADLAAAQALQANTRRALLDDSEQTLEGIVQTGVSPREAPPRGPGVRSWPSSIRSRRVGSDSLLD